MTSHASTASAHGSNAAPGDTASGEPAHPNYVKIWAILVGLLVVSVCGPMLGIKAVTIFTAFGIALIKAYLVAKNFMHLNIERRFVVYLLLTMLAFMLLLFGGVAPDVMRHSGRNWENIAAQEEIDRALAAAGGSEQGSKPAAAQAAPQASSAAENYKGVCGPCHGEKGEGNGPAAVALNPKPANFADPAFWSTRSKTHIEKVIREGGPAVGKSPLMAPFGGRFSPPEISALADYLATFKK